MSGGTLDRFEVVHAAGDFGGRGTLVHAYDGRQLVLTAVTHEALEDYFQTERYATSECALIVERNLDAFRDIIAAKYAAGDFTTYQKYGQTYPLITVFLGDMERSGHSFSDSVVEMARAARWAKV
jgi:hypothetical protein